LSGLYQTATNNAIRLRQHPGQLAAWDSRKRIIAVLAGTQGGKTSWLPWWLHREVAETADPAGGDNDYLAITASYDLFKLKFLPALREIFETVFGTGRYWAADRIIELADPATGLFWAKRADDRMWGRIILRSAESGGGLESATARAAIFDEAGQDNCTIDTYLALRRRLTLHRGRLCLGTTLYNMGWLKGEIYDPWERAKGEHPEIEVIQFDSIMNPAFPRDEYEAARASMPAWKFDMQYRGRFERPAGLIYDCFDELGDVVDDFPIPASWPRFLGLDFGGVNTVGVFYAQEPGSDPTTFYLYREYHAGGRTAKEHATELLKGEPRRPTCFGGSRSEGQWRSEFNAAGLPVNVSEVEIGISHVYGAHTQHRVKVLRSCRGYLEQKRSYRRAVDARGDPTEAIEDKHAFHFMDAERYILSYALRSIGGDLFR
jgi:hypothetical protein